MKRTVNGACPLDCPDTCAWQIEVEDGRAVRMRGRKDHPYTRGSLCGKVNRYLDAVYAPDRLTVPLRRVGAKGDGRFQEIDWDEAITTEDREILESTDPDACIGTRRRQEFHMVSDKPGLVIRQKLLALLEAHGEKEVFRG